MRNGALGRRAEDLGQRIVAELTDLSLRQRDRFIDIMRWHSYHVLAMSVQDENEEFFRAVAN